jgi:glucokinase
VAVAGIDLGGTKVQGVLLEGEEVVAEARVSTPSGGPDAVAAAVAGCVERLGGTVEAVGIGAPGAIDVDRGEIVKAPNLPGFEERVPLARLVAEATGAGRVVLDNDVNAGTLAELRLGAGRGATDLLCVFAGTGVGGGLVLDGRLRRGPQTLAGEIGHLIVREGGRECGCGLRGHVEAYAGRASMEREARRRHSAGEETALVDLAGEGRMKSGAFAKALAAGDAVAVALLDEAVEALGAGIAGAVALLDLPLVVLGGGLADKLGPGFAGRVEQAARERLFVPSSPLRVLPAELGDHAGAIGAALLAAPS